MILSHIFYHSLVQGMDLAGMVLLVGGLTFRTLVVTPSSGQASFLERLLPFLLLLIGLGDLVLRSQMISGQPLEEIWSFLPAVLFKSHFGKVWTARTFLLCVLGVAPITKIQGRITKGVAIAAGTLLLLTASLSGHAADSGDLSLAVLVDWLHLVAVSAWMGGLFFLALLLRKKIMLSRPEPTSPSALITSVKRFSALAGVCVVLILATGSYQAWHRVGGISALLQTSYGQILGVKLVLVISLLCLGALNRYRILPELSQRAVAGPASLTGDSWRRLHNTVTFEIGLGLGIIACVALLLQLPPARSQWASAYNVSSHPAGHLDYEQARPAKLMPAEGASIKILSPKEGEVFKGDEVPLRYTFTKGKLGAHLHAYVDGELMGMFSDPEKGTLTGIPPGHHTLELRVVAEDHQTELDATDKVHFMVK